MANLTPDPSGVVNSTRNYIKAGECPLLYGETPSVPTPAGQTTVIISGHHYTLAKEPPPGGFSAHGTLVHFHTDASQSASVTNIPIDVFGVSGFFGDEVVRGFSIHNLATVSGSPVSAIIRFRVADMTPYNGTPIGGTHGESAFAGILQARAFLPAVSPNVGDFDAASNLLGSFTITGGVSPGDQFQFGVPVGLIIQPAFGLQIRRQDETPFVNDEGICFDRAELTVVYNN